MGKGSTARPIPDRKTFESNFDAIFKKKDPYASEAETDALIVEDTRSLAQRTLDETLKFRGADEQGADSYKILYDIAVELIEKRNER
jgi:hypothetical protein